MHIISCVIKTREKKNLILIFHKLTSLEESDHHRGNNHGCRYGSCTISSGGHLRKSQQLITLNYAGRE